MKSTRIACFGDSWTQGAELLPGQVPYGKLLADRVKGRTHRNYAVPGSCIAHLTVQFKRHLHYMLLNPGPWVAIFFLTAQERFMAKYDDRRWIWFTPHGSFHDQTMDLALCQASNEAYWRYIWSPEISDILTNTTIMSLQTQCRHHGIDDYYILGWQKIDLWPGVEREKFFDGGNSTCADLLDLKIDAEKNFDRSNPYIHPNISHPNAAGHERIANELHRWIYTS